MKRILFFLLLLPGIARSQSRDLAVGTAAPPLTIQEWVKGKPVTGWANGGMTVVEFSGTWCIPCRKSIPHLSEMAEKYAKELTVISVYNEMNDTAKAEDVTYVKKVRELVRVMGNKMNFAVAVDVPLQTTSYDWKMHSWPTAFLVDEKGIVRWRGHPDNLEEALAKVKEGTYDEATELRKQQELNMYLKWLSKQKKAGNCSVVLKAADSLAVQYAQEQWFHLHKFSMLVGCDDAKAYEWLQWLLDNAGKGFNWPSLLHRFEQIANNNRNYALELKAIDRTIQESEIKYYAAPALYQKACTYEAMGNCKLAIKYCKQAIEYSQLRGGDGKAPESFKNKLAELQKNKS